MEGDVLVVRGQAFDRPLDDLRPGRLRLAGNFNVSVTAVALEAGDLDGDFGPAPFGLDEDDDMEVLVRVVVVGSSGEELLLDEILPRTPPHGSDFVEDPEEMGPGALVGEGDSGSRPRPEQGQG